VTSPRTLASVVIVLAIGLHALPVLYRRERGTLWPFMQWAMYKNSRPAGPVEVQQRRMLAVTASGARDTVTPRLLGLSVTVLEQDYLRPMRTGDTSVAPRLLDRLNQGREDPYVELRLESETYTVTDTGLARRSNPVVTYHAGRGGEHVREGGEVTD
jgi:hypothetical protein